MDKLFEDMQNFAIQHRVPIIASEAASLLEQVTFEQRPESILEIGTAIGYSTLLMARNTAPACRITTVEIDAERAAVAATNFSRSDYVDQINLIVGDAQLVLPQLAGSFDLVFIDAAKGRYLEYLLLILDKLRPGAVIFADNVLFRGWVRGGDPPRRFRTIVRRMREYLAFVTVHNGFSTTLHEFGDGVAVTHFRGETSS